MKAKAVSLKSDTRKRATTVEGNEVKGQLFQIPLNTLQSESDTHTLPSWPKGLRSKTKDWQREMREARKTTMGVSNLKPNSKFKKKAIELLRNATREKPKMVKQREGSFNMSQRQSYGSKMHDYQTSIMSTHSQIDDTLHTANSKFFNKRTEQIPLKGRAALMTNVNTPEINFAPHIQKHGTARIPTKPDLKKSYDDNNTESLNSTTLAQVIKKSR